MNRIAITGNTRMSGDDVCISAYDVDDNCYIRPQPPGRWHYTKREIIELKAFPFNLLECDYTFLANNQKPHIEDCSVSRIRYKRPLRSEEIQKFLDIISKHSLTEIYGAEPDDESNRFYHADRPPDRSLGTIVPTGIPSLSFFEDQYKPGKHKIRLRFTDSNELTSRNVPIVDLRLINYLNEKLTESSYSAVASAFNRFIRESHSVYVRLGLSRVYRPPGKELGYWIEVTG